MRALRIFGSVLLLALCAIGKLASQEETDCVDCINQWVEAWADSAWAGWGHRAMDVDHEYAAYSRGRGTHPRDIYPWTCSVKHRPCRRGGGRRPGPIYDGGLNDLLDSVIKRIRDGDAYGALQIVLAQPEHSSIRFVAERMAIQVRACDERYVAVHLPLANEARPEVIAAIAEAFERPRPAP